MDSSDTQQMKKDWISLLASTSGIMLTISLMVLTVVYTSQSDQIPAWQRMVICLCIVGACGFLMLCSHQSLRALGSLIIAAGYKDKSNTAEAEKANILSAQKALQAQNYFKYGMVMLGLSVALTFIFLSVNAVNSMSVPTVP